MAYKTLKKSSGTIQIQNTTGLKQAALLFLRERCENLKFDEKITKQEEESGILEGHSIKEHQIPYNMEMDINRLCLQNALAHFLDSGAAEDALPVYLCFMEIFIGDYGQSRSMVELLSEFENNGSSLLLKHRDHYSHSVYVFSLGLAIYETNTVFREAFKSFYKYKDEQEAAHAFLEYWGMTSLFHDIGYPFELPFEQVASYFEVNRLKRDEKPYMAYNRLDSFIQFDTKMKRRVAKLYEQEGLIFESSNELFAYELEQKLGETYVFTKEFMEQVLMDKPTRPDKFFNYMDHAFFSATLVFRRIYNSLGKELTRIGIDAMTAILLHNSLYKFKVAYYKDPSLNKPLDMNLHPLAYLLMLCDELQCWDRTAYGRNSRSELQPMDARITFENGGIQLCYIYDDTEKEKFEEFLLSFKKWESEKPVSNTEDPLFDTRMKLWKKSKPKLKECSNMQKKKGSDSCAFLEDIQSIVDLSKLPVRVDMEWAEYEAGKKGLYLSRSNFIHLYNFAVALNGRYMLSDSWRKAREENSDLTFLKEHLEEFEQSFQNLSLEYQLSNINQARAFSRYLNAIDCFYTDRPVDYPLVKSFSIEELGIIGPLEHERWEKEHQEMGWEYGIPKDKNERENKRIHPDIVPYKALSEEDLAKDIEPFMMMLELIRLYDGLRIYRL